MANKRITELASMTSASLDLQDLLLVVDRSFGETKNITISEIISYLATNLIPDNSINSTYSSVSNDSTTTEVAVSSSYAVNSELAYDSLRTELASVSLGGGNSSSPFRLLNVTTIERDNIGSPGVGSVIYNTTSNVFEGYGNGGWTSDVWGTATSASYSPTATTASYAFTASYALSSSNSLTSSYALSSSYAFTASYALSSSNSFTASYALSSSNSLTSSYALSSSNSLTSSYSGNSTSASYASASALPYVLVSANGAVDPGQKLCVITKGSACAITLAAPTTNQNGTVINFVSSTAFAHTITATNLLIDGTTTTATKDLITFPSFIGASITLMGYGGLWSVLSNINCTVS